MNNWTAVCNAGVVGAALYLEPDLSRLAEMIARAARSMDDFLSTFDADGGSSEGPGYWTYGFGNYCVFAEQVEWRTGGRIRFMDEPIIRKAAQFPLRTLLGPGVSVNFSDCDRNVTFIPAHLTYLSKRLDLPDLMKFARVQPGHRRQGEIHWALRDLRDVAARSRAGRRLRPGPPRLVLGDDVAAVPLRSGRPERAWCWRPRAGTIRRCTTRTTSATSSCISTARR